MINSLKYILFFLDAIWGMSNIIRRSYLISAG